MLTPPSVSKSMDVEEARMNLQKAINSLFILHQAIGQLPYRIIMGEHTGFHDLREFHQKGEKFLEELASDDIPF